MRATRPGRTQYVADARGDCYAVTMHIFAVPLVPRLRVRVHTAPLPELERSLELGQRGPTI